MSTPIPITEKKKVFTLRDLPELAKIPPKNPLPKVLPDNVVTLSSLRQEKTAVEKAAKMKTEPIVKKDEVSECLTEAAQVVNSVTQDIRESIAILREGHIASAELHAEMSEALTFYSQRLEEQKDFLKQFDERKKEREAEVEEFILSLKTIGEEKILVQEQKEQEVKALLNSIKEKDVEQLEKVDSMNSAVSTLTETRPDSNKTLLTKAWEGLVSVQEKVFSFFFSFGNG